jgi:predicted MFS family arabinose efflux permease
MRNVWILALAQALTGCGTIVLVAFGGIVGTRLASSPALATLPLSLAIVGVAATSIPAALAMQRWGRKRAFLASAAFAAAASLVCAAAVARADFALLCVGGAMLGANMAFVQQYRFAATEYVALEHAGRAISTVMLGTLVAAVLAPELGDRARLLGGWPEFTGSFVALSGVCVVGLAVLALLEPAHAHEAAAARPARPLATIARQPGYRVAVLCSVAGYAVMSFIMTATPISMHVLDGMDVAASKQVITAHLLGMYLPSLASGWLIDRLGLPRMMYAGLGCMGACVAIAAVVGHHFVHYLVGLVLLGVGWNLLFVAGSTLLTRSYTASERFRAQGLHDFATFGTQALASLLAGASIHALGWTVLNLASVPLLLVAAAAIWTWHRADARTRAHGASA